MTIEQSELHEKIARLVRRAMVYELCGGTHSERQANRERVGDLFADAIMALLERKDAT